MRFQIVAALGLLASTAAASGASILGAISTLATDSAKLNNTVLGWDGSLLGALPIIGDASTLLSDTNSAAYTAQSSANLSSSEALSVGLATLSLSSNVNQTLDSIVGAKSEFKKLGVASLILVTLKEQKSATDKFSSAVLSKVPAELQSTASNIIAGIDAAFGEALHQYNLLTDF